jgi:hypothetical protein
MHAIAGVVPNLVLPQTSLANEPTALGPLPFSPLTENDLTGFYATAFSPTQMDLMGWPQLEVQQDQSLPLTGYDIPQTSVYTDFAQQSFLEDGSSSIDFSLLNELPEYQPFFSGLMPFDESACDDGQFSQDAATAALLGQLATNAPFDTTNI